jgi:hypothetical protein
MAQCLATARWIHLGVLRYPTAVSVVQILRAIPQFNFAVVRQPQSRQQQQVCSFPCPLTLRFATLAKG